MRWVWLVLAGCGRVGFDPFATSSSGDGGRVGDGVSADALPAGLVAWFPLDGNTNDVVGGGIGTCGGSTCPAVTTGAIGSGRMFDGIDDCVAISDYAALHQATPTVAIRSNMAVLGQDVAALSKRVDIAASPANTWEIGTGPTNALEVNTSHGTSANQGVASPDNELVAGTWQHLAFTYDGTNTRVYINGVQRNSSVNLGALTYDSNVATIGCDDNGGPVRFYKGVLDDVQIYDHVLSPTEISQLAGM